MRIVKLLAAILIFSFVATVGGVYATWNYYDAPEGKNIGVDISVNQFQYGSLYITSIKQVGGSYAQATVSKTGETSIASNITLNSSAGSTVVLEVTFYNSTDISYYYNEMTVTDTSNNRIAPTASGIEKKDEIPSKTYKTITVTYRYTNGVSSNKSVSDDVHFNFTIDKDSIGIIVAQNAVTRFEDILNNRLSPNTYQTLENAMNNRGSNSSSVSYIGNVAGAKDADSELIQSLFTNEFLSMDLDGDGDSEPITIMIKRENLDGNTRTGDSYTYKSLLGISRTVEGVEFTLYITSEGFDKKTLTVYAVTYTKFAGSDEWVQVVELTEGTADANRYSIGLGKNNSFNTDTWESTDGKSMDELAKAGIQALQ